jgi:hypothetical protein
MTPGEISAFAVAAFTALAFLVQTMKYRDDRRKDAMEDGARVQEMLNAKISLNDAWQRIREIDGKVNNTNVDMAEMKSDIKHLVSSVEAIGSKLDNFIQHCIDAPNGIAR